LETATAFFLALCDPREFFFRLLDHDVFCEWVLDDMVAGF
jgi:hypothetical protein